MSINQLPLTNLEKIEMAMDCLYIAHANCECAPRTSKKQMQEAFDLLIELKRDLTDDGK